MILFYSKCVLSPPPFPEVAAILRAATRFSFPHHRSWAIQVLEEYWPSELYYLDRTKFPHALETVVLGRAYDVPGILKRAFYELLRSRTFLMDEAGDEAEGGNTTPQLEMNDIKRLISTRENLTTAWVVRNCTN
ncbi:hypothetical protein SERLA73DRAFT_144506 [Serpula lacrymans var. lacrymans S7.3]|uniref:Uncharacterized protein n=1 Tax=Serpula lacrymans var. lacrymans (strain S7.3) TaxID=936435 RepID=F8QBV8_SERL3|nr:hypothetical protein SERLA73DRAFT_144506 [Serpula lacrymans var. lacrymans S7.3]